MKITPITFSTDMVQAIEADRKTQTSGSRALGYTPSLSFTEYDFVNGGFSQVRPLPKIEKDTLVYVKSGDMWLMLYFAGFTKEGYAKVYEGQATSANAKYTLRYREWSLTNPLESK